MATKQKKATTILLFILITAAVIVSVIPAGSRSFELTENDQIGNSELCIVIIVLIIVVIALNLFYPDSEM